MEPDRAEVYTLLGRLELTENRLPEAIAAFRRSLALEPGQEEIRFELARTLRWVGHLNEAIQRLQDLHFSQPDNDAVMRELARALSSNWNYARALPLWERLRARHPADRDIQLSEALAALHTGSPQSAIINARIILNDDPDNLRALTIMADEAEFGGRPGEAAGWVERIITLTTDPNDRLFQQNRLLSLWRQLNKNVASHQASLGKQENLVRQMMADAPRNVDVRLTLASILVEQRKLDEAERLLLGILGEFNPRHYRANMALFEIALARGNAREAHQYLEAARHFHRLDPYLNWYQARLHASANELDAAYAALDRLAAAGERGATAVLLHHALTESDYGPALSVSQFRDHLLELMHAGYEFVTPEEIHTRWENLGPDAGRTADGRLRRVVAITFDDALDSAMRLATPVGLDLGLRFAQYVIAGYVERGDPYLSTWNELARYGESGVWEYGSHLYYAHDRHPIDSAGILSRPAANRTWLASSHRLESHSEFASRMAREYSQARELISRNLGYAALGIAYPYGDIGQEDISNMPDAVPINLQHAANQHAIGFIQTPFAHAVRGANPLLYSRHEMNINWSGDQVVHYLIDRHPFILAERTRLEFAQWYGQSGIARQALDRLRVAGYPSPTLNNLTSGLTTNMAPVFGMPATAGEGHDANRLAELNVTWFQDNLKANHWRTTLEGAMAARPDMHLVLRAGAGRLYQGPDRQTPAQGAIDLSETIVEMFASHIDARRWVWTAGLGLRAWSGDDDRNRLHAQFDLHGRLTPEIALRLGVLTDTTDQAQALARRLSRTRAYLEGRWEIATDWSLNTDGAWEEWSDNNRLLQMNLRAIYEPLAWQGIFIGARMTHRQSDRNTPGIWTPKRFEGYYGVVGRRGVIGGGQYEVSAQAGAGRETTFAPVNEQETDAPIARTELREDWATAYSASGAWRQPVRNQWQAETQVDWNRNPTYEEYRLRGALIRRF